MKARRAASSRHGVTLGAAGVGVGVGALSSWMKFNTSAASTVTLCTIWVGSVVVVADSAVAATASAAMYLL